MNTVFNLIFSPIGRVLSAVFAVLVAIATIYKKGKSDAEDNIREKSSSDTIKRLTNAINASHSVSSDPNKLRENDGFKRD